MATMSSTMTDVATSSAGDGQADGSAPPAPPRISSRRTGSGSPVGTNAPGSLAASPFAVAPYYPNGDAQTYRDLLIFEERLKQNAARLVKRKTKYQTFLVLLCATIGIFSYYVVVCPSQLQPLHYFNVTGLLMTATMLLLFFASGMYAERITAANKFVPQANRSLRSFNLYLNTRTAPRRSLFSIFRTSAPQPTRTLYVRPNAANGAAGTAPPTPARRLHIPTIPPSSNPRGEMIFSGKVTTSFREGYERYRAAFERRRAEKMQERLRSGWRRWWAALFGSDAIGLSGSSNGGDANGLAEKGAGTPTTARGSPAPSLRASVRSSPRTKKRSALTGVSSRASGSEDSTPASSRGASPDLAQQQESRFAASGPQARRGRRRDGDGEAATSTPERRGRDRTPSVTAVADGRIVRRNSMLQAGGGEGKEAVSTNVDMAASTPSTPPAIAEEPFHASTTSTTDEDDAAAAAAQLFATPDAAAPPPDPSLVVAQTDDRADASATLREPDA